MTMSAAWGRPVQHDGFTVTWVAVPSLCTRRKPTSASLRTWCEHVDWLMPSRSVSSPTVIARPAVATACSNRTRVGSARHANQSA
jgi:hypothetical protein